MGGERMEKGNVHLVRRLLPCGGRIPDHGGEFATLNETRTYDSDKLRPIWHGSPAGDRRVGGKFAALQTDEAKRNSRRASPSCSAAEEGGGRRWSCRSCSGAGQDEILNRPARGRRIFVDRHLGKDKSNYGAPSGKSSTPACGASRPQGHKADRGRDLAALKTRGR